MYKKLLLSLFLIQSLIGQIDFQDKDIYLYIDNFDASASETVTFDIRMNTRTPVYGAQFDVISGNGKYDDVDNCICDLSNEGAVPVEDEDGNSLTCFECYFDNGLDRVLSTYEDGHASSGNECEDVTADGEFEVNAPGICSNALYTSESTCEEYGECNNGKTSLHYDCFIDGFTDEANYPTCIVSSVTEIGQDLDFNTFIDACETQHQACDYLGYDDNGAVCNWFTFDNGPNGEYCTDTIGPGQPDLTTNCCASANADFKNWNEEQCEDTYGECGAEASDSECSCFWDGAGNWVGAGYTWYPYDLWTPYSLPAVCQANVDFDGVNYHWNYANTDPGGDDYRIYAPDNPSTHGDLDGGYQYCIVPGPQDGNDGMIPGPIETYNEYIGLGPDGAEAYNMAGHCSIDEGYCVGTEGANEGLVLDWPQSCCSATQGGLWINPYRDYELCTQTALESGQPIPNQGDWTAYSSQAICEENDGIWIGSTTEGISTEKNKEYDWATNSSTEESGENFLDANHNLDITSIDASHLPTAVSASLGLNTALGPDSQGVNRGDRVLIFSFTAAEVFPVTDYCDGTTAWDDDGHTCVGNADKNEVECCNLTGTWTEGASHLVVSVTADKNVAAGSTAIVMSKNVCSDDDDTNCPVSAVFSDETGDAISLYFDPYIWPVDDVAGYSLSDGGFSDGDCFRYIGETNATSPNDCAEICGDGICNGSENFVNCQTDCESAVGDNFCNLYAGETFENAIGDCTESGCGDYVCAGAETSESCSEDCLTICGNSSCDTGENETNCPSDCSTSCGNGVCENNLGEHFVSCAQDCSASTCGDGYYHHAGLGGTEDGSCTDYQLVCGDGVYHYLLVNGTGVVAGVQVGQGYEAPEDENCDDYVISDGDAYYHYLGLESPNGIVADASNAENNSSLDYSPTYNDNVCDCTIAPAVCGDYSSAFENPSQEPACATSCGDGYYHHTGNVSAACPDCAGTETDVTCPLDYTPKPLDGICDGSSGTGESVTNGNGESSLVEPACSSSCGDGYCEAAQSENGTSCPEDCMLEVNGVCARWTILDDDVTALENAYNSVDCTYNNTDFDLCGNGICDDGSGPISSDIGYGFTYNWGETVGTSAAGTCDLDCSTTSACTYGEDDFNSAWYNYEDCYSCADDNTASFTDNDGCQEGYGETADPSDPKFCYYDCWTGCGDGACDGTLAWNDQPIENGTNCTAQVSYQYPEDQLGEITILPNSTGDCILDIGEETPRAYSLSNNYPNPFNPATTIHYSVQNAGNVKIDIYNVLGQHVYTLVDEYCIPGVMYQVVWDSSVDSKTPLSSGVYFYQMISGNFEQEGMMTIIK